MSRYGMVVDLKRCEGCDTCTIACKAISAAPRGILWSRVLKYETGKYPNSRLNFLPTACMQCRDAECVRVCPTGAITRRDDGIVVVDNDKCTGCRYCMIACPYACIYLYEKESNYYPGYVTPYEEIGSRKHKIGTVEKCDFCVDRVEQGLQPACVTSCTGNAMFFGDLSDPDSEVSRLIKQREGFVLNPEMGAEPSIYYLPSD
jgi:Fe-S-cluster-containing dehydrogenase component